MDHDESSDDTPGTDAAERLSRRRFLTTAGLLGAGLALAGPAAAQAGIDSLQVLRQNLAVARDFQPMTAGEMTALARRCQTLDGDGHLELYKSTKKYDAAVGRSQHNYLSPEELPMRARGTTAAAAAGLAAGWPRRANPSP